jgi:putative peptide zinc metalloprotease protein
LSAIASSRKLTSAARPEDAAKALAARHGAPSLRPALRKDLGIHRQVQLGEVNWIVKDPVSMKYNQFENRHWRVVRLFDGRRTREEIRVQLERDFHQEVAMETVLEYEELLRRLDLIEQSVAERNLGLLDKFSSFRHQKAEQKSEGFNIFFIMFHVLDPDRFMNRTAKYVRWIWRPPVVIATIIACLWTLMVFIRNWQPIFDGTMDLYHFIGKPLPQVLQFFAILCVVGTIHEFAHAYAVKIYGGEVHDIGMALFYFTPAFYCDTSDAFMFENRFHRLWVTIAGVYSELIIACIATALWVASYPDTLLHLVAYKTMLFCGLSAVLFNINPLIKVDGYYALSSLLRMPRLRETAWHTVGAWFQKTILRLPVEIPPTTRRKRILYWAYGLLSIAYTTLVMLFIYRLFRNFWLKYFPDFGVVFLILTLSYVFKKKLKTTRRVGKLLYLDKKELFLSPRSRLPIAGIAVGLLLFLAVPWTHRTISGDADLKPENQARIEAPENGLVAEVLVHEGDTVAKNQPLFRLESSAPSEEEARHRGERDRFLARSSAGRASADARQTFQPDSMAASEEIGRRSAETRKDYLLVRSPIAGRVLTPHTEDLVGRYVTGGMPLAEIGDCRKMIADVAVSERLLEYLKVGSPVDALIRTRPTKSWKGSVAAISPATLEQPVTSVAGSGPDVPSENPDRFVVRAVFDNSDGTLFPGAGARVKITSGREAYLSRAWRVFWRWLRSVIW